MQVKLPVLLGTAGIALALVALLGPWWALSSTRTYTFQSAPQQLHIEYGMFSWSESSSPRPQEYSQLPRMAIVLTAAATLLVSGLFVGCGFVVASGLMAPGFRSRLLGAVLGLAAVAFTLLAPLLVMVDLPPAYVADTASSVSLRGYVQESFPAFWGSWSGSAAVMTATWSCGAGWGWFLAVAASILLAAATTLVLRKSRSSVPTAPTVAAP